MSPESKQKSKAKNKGGAPAGNRNAVRHGLTTGQPAPGCTGITAQTNRFRRAVEDLALSSLPSIGPLEAGVIQAACAWHQHGLQARWWLKKGFDKMDDAQRLHFSRESARAFTERDKHLRLLGIADGPEYDPWKASLAYKNQIGPDADAAAPDAAQESPEGASAITESGNEGGPHAANVGPDQDEASEQPTVAPQPDQPTIEQPPAD
jgi:hypothetical protein